MNRCIFEGRILHDLELRTVNTDKGSTSVLNFRIGAKNRWDKDSFPNMEVWDKGAETIAKHFKKGKLIRVYCEYLGEEMWDDKETGEKKCKSKFRVNEFEFPPTNNSPQQTNGNNGNGNDDTEETPANTEEPSTKSPKRQSPSRGRSRQEPPATEDDADEIPF